ncbi:MAG: DHH family phosphoesterase, partial [Dehalococcoidales bacterium]|nr:DHH family phosphoesterase [Dehalococcoidales bacterium]
MNLPLKRWLVAPRISAGSLPGWPDVLAQILHNRGVSEPADVDAFLNDDGCQIFDPLIMEGVKISVERIGQAISRGEMIAIYGDFDADGVTAAALLRDVLAPLGARTITYIPNRAEEGYGVNNPALESLRAQGATLAITVDCGVSAVHEIDYARQIGLDVIVVDHHQIPQQLPDAVAVINPRRSDCEYPFKDLAAVGVAFKLAQALLRTLPIRNGKSASEIQREILDLVALGTVADVAPLLGENRALVRRGLESLKR